MPLEPNPEDITGLNANQILGVIRGNCTHGDTFAVWDHTDGCYYLSHELKGEHRQWKLADYPVRAEQVILLLQQIHSGKRKPSRVV